LQNAVANIAYDLGKDVNLPVDTAMHALVRQKAINDAHAPAPRNVTLKLDPMSIDDNDDKLVSHDGVRRSRRPDRSRENRAAAPAATAVQGRTGWIREVVFYILSSKANCTHEEGQHLS